MMAASSSLNFSPWPSSCRQTSVNKLLQTPAVTAPPEPAMGRLVRYRGVQIKSCKQHEIQPDPQVLLQRGVRQSMPFADQQVFEQNNRVIAPRTKARALQAALEKHGNRRPLQQCMTVIINPVVYTFMQGCRHGHAQTNPLNPSCPQKNLAALRRPETGRSTPCQDRGKAGGQKENRGQALQ